MSKDCHEFLFDDEGKVYKPYATVYYKTKEEFESVQQLQYNIMKLKEYVPELKEIYKELNNIQSDYTSRYIITKLPTVYEERMDAIAPKILAVLSIVIENLEDVKEGEISEQE